MDLEEAEAKAVRLVDLGAGLPAGEKCVLPLENGFKLATATEVAEILLKEYSNE